jgi:hypothetical protein
VQLLVPWPSACLSRTHCGLGPLPCILAGAATWWLLVGCVCPQAVAQGRVWSGRRAEQAGLVDAVGGLWRALEIAKQAAGIGGCRFPPSAHVCLSAPGPADAALNPPVVDTACRRRSFRSLVQWRVCTRDTSEMRLLLNGCK